MARTDSDPAVTPPLDDPWPPFLDLLDSDPQGAWVGLYVFAWKLVRLRQPKAFSKLPPEDQEDLASEFIQDLQKDGFRLLRMYRNQGRPFAVWFWLALRRRALDCHRIAKKRGHSDVPAWLPEDGPHPDGIVENREALRDLERIMEGLSARCQVLLKAAAQGYKPKELVGLLGLPADHNKKLADHLKNCRRSLIKALAKHGYTVDDVL